MVGQIGGLARAGNPSVTNAAADLARVWTAGWAAKDKAPLEKALAEVTAATAANQAVFDQAAAALKDLSGRGKALADAEAKLAGDQQKFRQEAAAVAQRLGEQEAALDAKRRATELALQQREEAVQAREDAVKPREAGVKLGEKANARLQDEALRATTAAAKAQQEADAIKADYEAKIAATKKIWA